MTVSRLPSIRVQREHARTRELRRAEQFEELTDAYLWWIVHLERVDTPTTPARDQVRKELIGKLYDARRDAARAKAVAAATATQIGDTLAAGAARGESDDA